MKQIPIPTPDRSETIESKSMMCRATTGDSGTTRVIASTPAEDRYGDIVSPPWDLDRYKANPVVQWSHDYTLPPVGRVISLEMDGADLIAEIEWDDSDQNPLGRTVAHQFRAGFLSAVSVGFAPGTAVARASLPDEDPRKSDRGMVYTGSELLEISAVPIPANPEALAIRSMSPDEIKAEALRLVRHDPGFCADIEAVLWSQPVADIHPLSFVTADTDPDSLGWLV